jgi:hypothetical protein
VLGISRLGILLTMPASDYKRCTKCGMETPLVEFSRASHVTACVPRWQQENAEHVAEYHRRWQQASRVKTREHDRRYGNDEPRTRSMWRAGGPTTAAIGSESEPESPTHIRRQTRGEASARGAPAGESPGLADSVLNPAPP